MNLKYLRGDMSPYKGFVYYDPLTNWTMPSPLSKSWATAASEILSHDRANPQLPNRCQDIDCARRKLDEYTFARLKRLGIEHEFYETDHDTSALARLIKTHVPAPAPSRCCGGNRAYR